ncbi:MAG: glycosyltransferase [Candidatus Bathyarchaeia archaeon]
MLASPRFMLKNNMVTTPIKTVHLVIVTILLTLFAVLFTWKIDIPGLLWSTISIAFTIFLICEFFLASFIYKPMGDKKFTPTVDVVVPVKNEAKIIYDTVKSVVDSKYPKGLLGVIVVNDGSTDGTKEVLERCVNDFGIRVINFENNMGKRIAVAEGVKNSEAEIIVIKDSDTFLHPDAIYNGVQYFVDRRVGAVCGHGLVMNKEQNMLTKMQDCWYDGMFTIFKATESVFGMVTCCSGLLSFYRRRAIKEMIDGWASERFLGVPVKVGDDRALTNIVLKPKLLHAADADDRLLTSEVAKKGEKVVYAQESLGYTVVPSSINDFLRQQIRWKKGYLRGNLLASKAMWRKHPIGASLYYLHFFLTLVTPAVVARVLFLAATGDLIFFTIFLLGLVYLASLYGVHYASRGGGVKSWLYRIPFQVIYCFLIAPFLTIYAWLTLRNQDWMTRRSDQSSLPATSFSQQVPNSPGGLPLRPPLASTGAIAPPLRILLILPLILAGVGGALALMLFWTASQY